MLSGGQIPSHTQLFPLLLCPPGETPTHRPPGVFSRGYGKLSAAQSTCTQDMPGRAGSSLTARRCLGAAPRPEPPPQAIPGHAAPSVAGVRTRVPRPAGEGLRRGAPGQQGLGRVHGRLEAGGGARARRSIPWRSGLGSRTLCPRVGAARAGGGAQAACGQNGLGGNPGATSLGRII